MLRTIRCLNKYLVNNHQMKNDEKYTVLKRKTHKKTATPVSNSIMAIENSIDSKGGNISQISNKTYLEQTRKLQTPRSGYSRKLKAYDSKKSDMDSGYNTQSSHSLD
jgi:hypothetical protein